MKPKTKKIKDALTNAEQLFCSLKKRVHKLGRALQEFVDAFPELNRKGANNLLQELRESGFIYFDGKRRARTGVWKLVRNR